MARVRNIGIIAHVDHGKTTLIDQILTQCGAAGRKGLARERVMDSNDLERERGITILSKNTAVQYGDHVINIVDTPGHADFGAEVERILRMVDSVLLLVDAAEGPMPQTRFVLGKSLALGLQPIVVINKVDRPDRRLDVVLDAVFDLFVALDANEEQLDFPVIYASGRDGWAVHEPDDGPGTSLDPLMDLIVEQVPAASSPTDDGMLQLQVATLDRDEYMGRICIGRIYRGRIGRGDRVVHVNGEGAQKPFRVTKLMGFRGTERIDIDEAVAGDIVALAGVDDVTVGDTLCSEGRVEPMAPIPIDEPTLTMEFLVNDSPFNGREGKFLTSRHLEERLDRELESNVALRVERTERADVFEVSGRGTLSLSVLIETMRREGYELGVSQPRVIVKQDEGGAKLEPYEEVVVECGSDFSGVVIEKLSQRGADLRDMRAGEDGITRIEFLAPSRGLIGYRGEFLTDTRGTGVLHHVFAHYGPWRGPLRRRKNGVLIALENCTTTAYSLFALQDRGQLAVGAGEDVYAGQLVGIHARENDLVVNPGKGKKLTNIRSAGADDKLLLSTPRRFGLEDALEFIEADELVEVTPEAIRLRKRTLDHSMRKREEKKGAAA
jgi:GTP-binding protein